jgi:hypothetical protein
MMNLPALVNCTLVPSSMKIGRAMSDPIFRRKLQSTTNVKASCRAATKAAVAPAVSSVLPSHTVHCLIDLVVVTAVAAPELEELPVVGFAPELLVDVLLAGELVVDELLADELVADGVLFAEPEGSGDVLAAVEAEPLLPAPPHAHRIDARDKTSSCRIEAAMHSPTPTWCREVV